VILHTMAGCLGHVSHVLASVVWEQWLQQRWIRRSFDSNQVPRLRFIGVAGRYGIRVRQPTPDDLRVRRC
jgi:hypothetical protein